LEWKREEWWKVNPLNSMTLIDARTKNKICI